MPRMLREIIREIADQDPRIVTVGVYSNPAVLAAALRRPGDCRLLQPGARTVAVLDAGDGALLLQPLAPERVELDELTPARLRDALAGAGAPPDDASPPADPPSPTG